MRRTSGTFRAFGRVSLGDIGERRGSDCSSCRPSGPRPDRDGGDNDAGGVSIYAQAGQNYRPTPVDPPYCSFRC